MRERVIRSTPSSIREHPATALSVRMIADAVGLSESRLAHLFSEHVGQPPQEYIEHQRLARAKLILESTDQTVAQIARSVGFDDPFYFTRRFRRSTGFSPVPYRRDFHSRAGVKFIDEPSLQRRGIRPRASQ